MSNTNPFLFTSSLAQRVVQDCVLILLYYYFYFVFFGFFLSSFDTLLYLFSCAVVYVSVWPGNDPIPICYSFFFSTRPFFPCAPFPSLYFSSSSLHPFTFFPVSSFSPPFSLVYSSIPFVVYPPLRCWPRFSPCARLFKQNNCYHCTWHTRCVYQKRHGDLKNKNKSEKISIKTTTTTNTKIKKIKPFQKMMGGE